MRTGICLAVLAVWLAATPVWAHETAAPVERAGGLLSSKDRKIYTEAFHKADRRRFRRARKLARKAKDPLPAKVIQWLELTEPSPGGDFDEAAAFLEGNPDWPGQTALRRRAERAMPKGLSDERVLNWFGKHPPITPEGGARYAEALNRAGEEERAIELLRAAWIEGNFPRRDERAFRKKHKKILRREDDIARLDQLLWNHKFRAAKRQARRLGGGYPALAEARLLLARRAPGVDWAVKRVPAELKDDPGLVYERARWRQRRGRYKDVVELLDPPKPDAPRPEKWWRVRKWAARQAFMKGEVSVAYRIASGHGLEVGIGFAEGEWLAGWIALRFLGEPQIAFRHFTRLNQGVVSPISLARSAFWAGEAARAMVYEEPAGDWHAAALKWYTTATEYKTTFYGQLASRRLGEPLEVDLSTTETVDEAAREAFDKRELVRLTRMLDELGETELQKRFLIRLRVIAETASDYALTAELATEQGRNDLAVRTAKAALADGIMLAGHLFPSLDLPEGGKPEAALVLAVVRQESAFYRAAVSGAGARGLMQLLPRTAKRVARQIRVKYSRKKLLTDPDYNLRLGRAYLAGLTKRYEGSYILALAAYNAGPSRANKWIKAFGDPRDPGVDPVDWIESIPFDETRNYVQRILESLFIYRQHLGAEDSDPLMVRRLEPAKSWAKREIPDDLSCCL